MSTTDDFQTILRAWRRRTDPTQPFTPNQIANFALGSGNSSNASRVGRTVAAYRQYFQIDGVGHGRRISVNWPAIERDHPYLVQGAAPGVPRSTPDREGSFRAMHQALTDERDAIRRDLAQNPISVDDGRRVPELERPGDAIYEFSYKMRHEESFFPIPDGAPVQVLLRNRDARDGTMLSQDSARSRLIVAFDSEVRPETLAAGGVLRPKLDELVSAIQKAVGAAEADRRGLHNRLFESDLRPARVRKVPAISGAIDYFQHTALSLALESDIAFLWGPPGTGKTHSVGEAIAHWVELGARVLAVSTANVAVDQICLKTRDALARHRLDILLDAGRILRLGHARDLAVLRDRRFFPDKERARQIRERLAELRAKMRRASELDAQTRAALNLDIKSLSDELKTITKEAIHGAAVVLTTVLQTCIDPSFGEAVPFDVVVVDEASMLPIPHLVAAAIRAKKQLLVAGDFRQLGPIALAKSQWAHDWLHRDVFELVGIAGEKLPAHSALAMLKRQRRMHPDISACVNQSFYGGLLENAAPGVNLAAAELPPLSGTGAVFLELPESDECAVEQTAGGSRRNKGSAQRSARLAAWYVRGNEKVEVAIITPYRAQVVLIQGFLRDDVLLATAERDRIHVGTIHTFQGSERDVVIWDLVETRNHPIGKLYRERTGDRLANVAITRAKGKLVLIGDSRAFSDAPSSNAVFQLRAIIASGFPTAKRIAWDRLEREIGSANQRKGTVAS